MKTATIAQFGAYMFNSLDEDLRHELALLGAKFIKDPNDRTGKIFLLVSSDASITYAEIFDDEASTVTISKSNRASLVDAFFECWALHHRLATDLKSAISINFDTQLS